jgi:hypothetical protein
MLWQHSIITVSSTYHTSLVCLVHRCWQEISREYCSTCKGVQVLMTVELQNLHSSVYLLHILTDEFCCCRKHLSHFPHVFLLITPKFYYKNSSWSLSPRHYRNGRWVAHHRGKAHSYVLDEGESFQEWKVAGNIVSKHSRAKELWWSSGLVLHRAVNVSTY